jgi:hypothetical protein
MNLHVNRILLAAMSVLWIAGTSSAAPVPTRAEVVFLPVDSNPPIPAGLKVTCMTGPAAKHDLSGGEISGHHDLGLSVRRAGI